MDIDIELYRGADKEYYGDVRAGPPCCARRRCSTSATCPSRGQIHLGPREAGRLRIPTSGPPAIHNIAPYGHCRLQLPQDGETVRDDRLLDRRPARPGARGGAARR